MKTTRIHPIPQVVGHNSPSAFVKDVRKTRPPTSLRRGEEATEEDEDDAEEDDDEIEPSRGKTSGDPVESEKA